MTAVSLADVTKVFEDPQGGEIVAVDNVSMEIDDGELIVLVGPSGCGKTTTLRMIAGLESPTSGEIRFDGQVVNGIPARNRNVAMVFQDFALYPHMTVRRNIGFGLARSDEGYSAQEIDEMVEDVAEMLEIDRLLDQKPGNLSGGQQQRVALGRAIVREPRVFLFDEPLANLDEKLQVTMRTEIVELQKEFGVTAVYVTHNQEEAMTVADRIVIMNDGRLQQIGDPKEVYTHPANLFVAQFIGSPSMNLFDATVVRENGDLIAQSDQFTVRIPDDYLDDDVDEDEMVVGVRPEDLSPQESKNNDESLTGEVTVVESLGRDALIHSNVGGTKVTARLSEYQDIARGATIDFGVDPRDVYLFDRSSGNLVKSKV